MEQPEERETTRGRGARQRLLARIISSVLASLAVAVTVAIGAALLDLYLSGHGYGSVSREVIHWPAYGVHLSPADIVLLAAAIAAGLLVWFVSGQGSR